MHRKIDVAACGDELIHHRSMPVLGRDVDRRGSMRRRKIDVAACGDELIHHVSVSLDKSLVSSWVDHVANFVLLHIVHVVCIRLETLLTCQKYVLLHARSHHVRQGLPRMIFHLDVSDTSF